MDNTLQTPDLRKVLAFRFLKDSEIADITPLLEDLNVPEGQFVLVEHTKDSSVYFLLEGTVNVMVESTNTSKVYIGALGEGESFAESGIFPKMPRSADIVAAEKSRILKIQRKDLLAFIAKHPAGGTKILMMLIYSLLKKLRIVNRELAYERVEDSSQNDIDALVSDFMNTL